MVERRTEGKMTPTRSRVAKQRQTARRWMIVRVVLRGQNGEELSEPPGRDLLVSSAHTFAEIATAIDRAFARWDIAHLHEFQLADGKRVVGADDEGFEEGDLDETAETLDSVGIKRGGSFNYIFDLGQGWVHHCTVQRDEVDPVKETGLVPRAVVPIFGWGAIPDQYGRIQPDSDESFVE